MVYHCQNFISIHIMQLSAWNSSKITTFFVCINDKNLGAEPNGQPNFEYASIQHPLFHDNTFGGHFLHVHVWCVAKPLILNDTYSANPPIGAILLRGLPIIEPEPDLSDSGLEALGELHNMLSASPCGPRVRERYSLFLRGQWEWLIFLKRTRRIQILYSLTKG